MGHRILLYDMKEVTRCWTHFWDACINCVLYFYQLKILLDQVDEAVGDFDECILLRPDSALAQAQKCFALVSQDTIKMRFALCYVGCRKITFV